MEKKPFFFSEMEKRKEENYILNNLLFFCGYLNFLTLEGYDNDLWWQKKEKQEENYCSLCLKDTYEPTQL